MSDFDDLMDRVAALESNTIRIDQLPLADLRRALIDNGDPLDLSVLALPGFPPQAIYNYVWSTQQAVDVAGTFRAHPDGVQTFTAPLAGLYKVTLGDHFAPANAYTFESRFWTLGGSAQRLDQGAGLDDWANSAQSGSASPAHVALFRVTAAGQTLTFLPNWRVGSAGVVSQFHWSFLTIVELIGS